MTKVNIDNTFDVYKLRITEILNKHSEVLGHLQKDRTTVPISRNENFQAWLTFDETFGFVIDGTFRLGDSLENFSYNPDSGLSIGCANTEASRDIIAPELEFALLNWSPIERLIQDKIEVYENNFVERMYTINASCGYNGGNILGYITLSGCYKGIPNIVIRQFKDIPNQSAKIVFPAEEYLGPTLVISGDMGLTLGNSDRFYSHALKEMCEQGDINFTFELIDKQSDKLVSTIEVGLHKH